MWEWLKKLMSAAGTSGAGTSLGVVAGLLSAGAILVNIWFGADVVTSADQQVVVDQSRGVWDATVALWSACVALGGTLMALWARIRAKKNLSGAPLK